jgi:hypothetical protein
VSQLAVLLHTEAAMKMRPGPKPGLSRGFTSPQPRRHEWDLLEG